MTRIETADEGKKFVYASESTWIIVMKKEILNLPS